MRKKLQSNPKPKREPGKQRPKEDFNQATFRVKHEVIRRSEF